MKSLLSYVKRNYNIIKRLSKNIPPFLDDSEELVRRCRKKAIRSNGKIHKSVFFNYYPEISVDRSKYRPYKKTLQDIPKNESIDSWFLIGGIVKQIRPIKGVKEVKADPLPLKKNPAHALIICDSKKEKKNDIAVELFKVFKKIPEEKYRL